MFTISPVLKVEIEEYPSRPILKRPKSPNFQDRLDEENHKSGFLNQKRAEFWEISEEFRDFLIFGPRFSDFCGLSFGLDFLRFL